MFIVGDLRAEEDLVPRKRQNTALHLKELLTRGKAFCVKTDVVLKEGNQTPEGQAAGSAGAVWTRAAS